MILTVVDRLSLRLVPDELWALAEPLIPTFEPRPQAGGTAPLDARAVFTVASVSGPKPGCGEDSTTQFWTSSAAKVLSTGAA
jgi:hypothetical protein